MKNILKIFTILLLALNIVPGFAALNRSFIDAINKTTTEEEALQIYQELRKQIINNKNVQHFSVTGKLVDATSGENVSDAQIAVVGREDDLFTTSNEEGVFSLEQVPEDADIQIYIVTYKPKIVRAKPNMQIQLEPNSQNLDEAVVTAQAETFPKDCSDTEKHIKHGRKDSNSAPCIPIKCEDGYLNNKENQCVEDYTAELKKIQNSQKTIKLGSELTIQSKFIDVPDIKTALENWKTACTKIKKTAHVKESETEESNDTASGTYSVKCVIKECDSDDYTTNEDKTKCIKAHEECEQDRGGTWKLGACYCGNIIMTKDAICENGKIVSKKAQNKKSCNANAATTWKGGKCVCKDSTKELTATGACEDKTTNKKDNRTQEQKEKDLEEKEKAYEDAKEKEQSKENRLLTAATTAATGIGGMELAQGLAEQKADKAAEQDMSAYIATMRCTYGNGKQVKAGNEEIELPGGNDATLMKYRAEYIALANDLKERKAALDMKLGIESEEILDKADLGLYDDENTGITEGAYASLYRAQMLNNEKDQQQIDEAKKTSKTRVIAGGVAAGVGVVGGIVGDSLINGKLGEKIKESIQSKKLGKETQALLEKEAKALDDLRKCLKEAGVKNTDRLTFSEFYPSVLSVKGINCKYDFETAVRDEGADETVYNLTDEEATNLFVDTTDAEDVFNSLYYHFANKIIKKMTGFAGTIHNENESDNSEIIEYLQKSIESVQKKFKEAEEKDKESAEKAGFSLGDFTGSTYGNGISSMSALFSGGNFSNYFPSLNTEDKE